MKKINTHNLICTFGRHAGELYTRIPISYLKWMIQCSHPKKDIALAELERRGTVTPELDISGHAIDRASLYCIKIWEQTRHENEGLHAWLVRMSQEALELNHKDEKGRYIYNDMKFAFEEEGIWPVLKTIMIVKKDSKSLHE